MRTISESVYELLMAQGLRAMTVGAVEARGIGAGLREGADRPATAQAGEESASRSGMKRTGHEAPPVNREERQSRPEGGRKVGFNYVVHMNRAMSGMPMRKATERRTSAAFLMCIVDNTR